MRYEDLIGKKAPRWPYKVNYGKETQVACDVLVLGGGTSGIAAAIAAAKTGLKVILVDKGHVLTSGDGGIGVDHWANCPANPACTMTPDEFTKELLDAGGW